MTLNAESAARYQANRSLIQSNNLHLLAYLPEEYPSAGDRIDPTGTMERIELENEVEWISRSPKYAVIFGMGDGRWLLEYFQKHAATLKIVHVVEPNTAAFAEQMARFSWTPLLRDRRIHWFIGSSASDIKSPLLSDVPEIASWGIHAWRNTLSVVRHAEEYVSFLELLHAALRGARDNAHIQIERGLIMQSNILRNLPGMIRSMSLDAVANQFQQIPAVIIGAGPSLSRNIDVLREAAPGVLLIASDTALRPLLRHGIHPHIVVSCDPLQLNHRHFEGIPSLGEAILAYLPETNAEILQQFAQHPRLLCLHDLQSKLLQRLAGMLGIRKTFRRRMNVGYCSFILAQEMGCSPIILAGMDLAVSPGGLSHAEGTANASTVAVSGDGRTVRLQGNVETGDMPLVPVEAYDGGQTLTFTFFHQILRTLEKSIAGSLSPVIDATEGGAKKRGAIQMPLRDALRHYAPSEPVAPRLNARQAITASSSTTDVFTCLQEIYRGLQAARSQLHWGQQRIAQWTAEIEKNAPSIETVSRQAEFILSRLSELLSENAMDTGVDIGLARWRYAIQRAEPPEGVTAKELGDWWSSRFREWFEGLEKDMELFENLYAHVIQTTQTILTSRPERQ